MTHEEQRTWTLLVVTVVGYAVYVVVVLGRWNGALAETPYVAPMLWCIGGAIVAAIVGEIVLAIVTGTAREKRDQRDREIYQFGEYVGNSMVVIGGLAALVLAVLEADHFWIANVVYLAFVLSAILGSLAKLSAYREGLPQW